MQDVRIINESRDSDDAPIAAQVRSLTRAKALIVAQVNVSGDIVNPGAGGSGGDGAINDGADSGIKATVKDYASSNPLAVVLTNVSGDVYNSGGGGGDGAINDGADSAVKATVKDYTNSNPLVVALANVSGDVYNANSVTINKWNLTPTQDAVHVNSGLLGITGDVNTRPQSVIGVQIVGGSVGARMSASGDLDIRDLNPAQDSVRIHGGVIGVTGDVATTPKAGEIWNVREQGQPGVQVLGGQIGGTIGVSGDTVISVNQRGAWATAVTGDVILQQSSARVLGRIEGPIGVQIVGYSGTAASQGVSGDVSVKPSSSPTANVYFPISGDTGIRDGVDPTIKGTVRDYANSNPLAVVLTNASGDTYNAGTKIHVLTTVAGRVTSAGSTSIVSAVSARKIKVTAYDLQGDGDNARGYFASGASGSQLTPEWELASLDGVAKQVSASDGGYIFSTAAGSALSFESSSTKAMKYSISYHSEDAL